MANHRYLDGIICLILEPPQRLAPKIGYCGVVVVAKVYLGTGSSCVTVVSCHARQPLGRLGHLVGIDEAHSV